MRYARTAIAVMSIVLLGTATSCSPTVATLVKVPRGTITLKGAGATFPAPLYEKWFAEYTKQHPGVAVSYEAVGSGEGIRRFVGLDKRLAKDELVDFGASDAAMTDAEMERVARGVQIVPMTAGAVVLAYNLPDFAGDLKLSRKAVAGIFLGEITNWNDPAVREPNGRAALPNMNISVVTRRDSSGTTFTLTNHLAAISEPWRNRFGAAKLIDWPGAAMNANGNAGVAGRINQAVGSIGYVQFGFAERLGLRMASIENKSGNYVAPTEKSTAAALAGNDMPENLRLFFSDPEGEGSYPIVTMSWILLYKSYADAKKAASLRDLFAWCLTDGQSASESLGYVRLPEKVVSPAMAAVETINTP